MIDLYTVPLGATARDFFSAEPAGQAGRRQLILNICPTVS